MRRLFWVFVGTRNIASSRIHGYRIHDKLVELGFSSHILFEPNKWTDKFMFRGLENIVLNGLKKGDTLILQKVKDPAYLNLLLSLKQKGVKLGFIDCDLPLPDYYLGYFDFIVCPSNYLKNIYLENGFTNVIHIPDTPEVYRMPESKLRDAGVKVVWFGNSTNGQWKNVEFIKNALEVYSFRFDSVSDHADATIKWNANAFDVISTYDISLIQYWIYILRK